MGSVWSRIKALIEPMQLDTVAIGADPPISSEEAKAISLYLRSDRTPHFAPGYSRYKERLVLEAVADPTPRAAFLEGKALPDGFGEKLDERIVEYPWVLARLPQTGMIFDAGSTLNKDVLLKSPSLRGRHLLIYTLWADRIGLYPNVSFLFGDLRDIILKNAVVDCLVCISTLEHVGFTYDYKTYSRRNPWPEAEPDSYLDAVREFARIIRPGGRFLLTVPFGKREAHGWLQQVDSSMVDAVEVAFGGDRIVRTIYRYANGAWQLADEQDCAEIEYFNIHETGRFDADGVAAARAVCCLDLRKN